MDTPCIPALHRSPQDSKCFARWSSTIALTAKQTHSSLNDQSWRRSLAAVPPSNVARFSLVNFNMLML